MRKDVSDLSMPQGDGGGGGGVAAKTAKGRGCSRGSPVASMKRNYYRKREETLYLV